MGPTDDSLAQLEDDAHSILRGLPSDHAPIVVEFAGSPKAGKSTTIDILQHFFKRMGFKVWAPSEGAGKRTPYHLKRDLVAFNTWTLNYAISELLVAYYNVDHHNLIILDRGLHDSLAWMGLLHKRQDQNLDEREFAVFKDYAVHTRWVSLISRLYLFTCSVKDSLHREHDAKLTRRTGTAMNEEMLGALLREYEQLGSAWQEPYKVHTSAKTTPLGTSYELAVDILGLLRSRLPRQDGN